MPKWWGLVPSITCPQKKKQVMVQIVIRWQGRLIFSDLVAYPSGGIGIIDFKSEPGQSLDCWITLIPHLNTYINILVNIPFTQHLGVDGCATRVAISVAYLM